MTDLIALADAQDRDDHEEAPAATADVAFKKLTYRCQRAIDDMIRAHADVDDEAQMVTYHEGWNDRAVAAAISDEIWGGIPEPRRYENVVNFRWRVIGNVRRVKSEPVAEADLEGFRLGMREAWRNELLNTFPDLFAAIEQYEAA